MAEVIHHDAAIKRKLILKTFIERIMKNTNFKQNNFETVKCDSPSHSSVYFNDQARSVATTPGLKHDIGAPGIVNRDQRSFLEKREKRIDNGVINENLMDKITKFTLFCVYLQCINKYEAKKRHIFCVSI